MKVHKKEIAIYCQAYDDLNVALVIVDKDLCVQKINKYALNVLGWSGKNTVIGRPLKKLCQDSKVPYFFNEDEGYHLRKTIKGKNRVIRWRSLPVMVDGESWFFLLGEDVTTQNTLEKKLIDAKIREEHLEAMAAQQYMEEAHTYLKNILSQIPGYVYWKDRNFCYLGCNKPVAESIGLEKVSDIIGKTDYDFGWNKDLVDGYRKIDEKIIKTGLPQLNVEEKVIDKRGNTLHLLVNKMPLFDQDGEVIGIVGVSVDITAQREAEEKVIEANQSKSRFIAAVDRLVRNPLTAILGTTQLLQREQLPSQQKEIVDIIAQSVGKITPILNRVQYYLDLENGSLKPTQDTFHLAEFFKRHVSKYQHDAEEKSLRFVFDYDLTLPEWVKGCTHFIAHTIEVLLTNAIKFTQRGEIAVVVSGALQGEHQLNLSLVVRDTGQGISPETQLVLFHLFDYRPEREEDFADSGLNLSITAKMLGLIDGKITVDSAVNKGTTFAVDIPLIIVEEPPYRKHPASYHYIPPEAPTLKRDLKDRIRILVIEDDTIVQQAFKMMVTNLYNCDIDQAYNLQEASQRIKNKYDIIFLDMNLPDGTGIEFLNFLRDQQLDPCPPIVVVTAFSNEDSATQIIEAGAQDIIIKPVSIDVLKDVILAYVFESQQDEE